MGLLVLPEVGCGGNDGLLAHRGNFGAALGSSLVQKMGDSLICFGTGFSIWGPPECRAVNATGRRIKSSPDLLTKQLSKVLV